MVEILTALVLVESSVLVDQRLLVMLVDSELLVLVGSWVMVQGQLVLMDWQVMVLVGLWVKRLVLVGLQVMLLVG
jgi:hypothetical protein